MIQKFVILVLDYLFPISCNFCGEFDLFSSKLSLCKQCYKERNKEKAVILDTSYCDVCKTELINEECNYCNSRNIFFSQLNYIHIRGEFEKEIIQRIKFGNAPYLSNYFRLGLRKVMRGLNKKRYTAIVSIPSNKSTIRKRPIPVCKPVTDFLIHHLRIKTIIPFEKKSKELQSGKSFRDRFIHAQSAFSIKEFYDNKLKGNYLLVDDVFTTGATINEMAKILLMNGANEVDVLVLVKGKI
jgi:competence protein ComFC